MSLTAWGHPLRLESASGVFSAGRLDTGTAVLLREAPPPAAAGTFLDLGCGYGVIACALAVQTPQAHIWAVDVNDRARRLCEANAVTAGVAARVHVAEPNGVPPEMCFDEIWSNPPIRVGKPALHDLLLRWLPRLTPNGRALLVVGKNLGADSLQRWLAAQGFTCTRLASAKGFRVLQVQTSS